MPLQLFCQIRPPKPLLPSHYPQDSRGDGVEVKRTKDENRVAGQPSPPAVPIQKPQVCEGKSLVLTGFCSDYLLSAEKGEETQAQVPEVACQLGKDIGIYST